MQTKRSNLGSNNWPQTKRSDQVFAGGALTGAVSEGPAACSTPHHHLPVHTLDYPLRSPRVFAEAPSYHLILQYQEWDCADFPAEFFHISYWYLSCNTIDNRQLTNPHNKSRAGQGFGSLFSPSQMGRSSISCQAFTGGAWCSLVSFPNPLESEVESLPRCSPPPHLLTSPPPHPLPVEGERIRRSR